MDSSSSCVKIQTLGTNPLLLVENVEGERCSSSSNKCQLQKVTPTLAPFFFFENVPFIIIIEIVKNKLNSKLKTCVI